MTQKKSPLSHILDEKKCVLECVQWQDADGSAMFAYVLMKKNNLSAFKKALGKGSVDLATFGVVVAHGAGSAPPEGFEQMVIESIKKVA